MANTNIMNKNISVSGVNSSTNYTKQRAFYIDFAFHANRPGKHVFFKLPDDEYFTGLKVFVVNGLNFEQGDIEGELKFIVGTDEICGFEASKLQHGGASFECHGYVSNSKGSQVELEVFERSIFYGKILVIIETVPVEQFVTNG